MSTIPISFSSAPPRREAIHELLSSIEHDVYTPGRTFLIPLSLPGQSNRLAEREVRNVQHEAHKMKRDISISRRKYSVLPNLPSPNQRKRGVPHPA